MTYTDTGVGALVIGAFDERIALTIPQETGVTGDAAWRITDWMGLPSIPTCAAGGAPWYTPTFCQFAGNVTKLPMDQHQLAAMIAPRGLLVVDNGATAGGGGACAPSAPARGCGATRVPACSCTAEYARASPTSLAANFSVWEASLCGRTVYAALGVADRMGITQLGHPAHCAFPTAQQPAVDAFVQRFLLGQVGVNTTIMTTDAN